MYENLLRIELYRILVSIAVGLITILVFIFNVSVAERYYHIENSYNESKKSTTNINFKWEDKKLSIKRTLRIFKENTISFLVISFVIGEFLGSTSLIFIPRQHVKSITSIYISFSPILRDKPNLTWVISEVHFAISKAFGGVSLGVYTASFVLIPLAAYQLTCILQYYVSFMFFLSFMIIIRIFKEMSFYSPMSRLNSFQRKTAILIEKTVLITFTIYFFYKLYIIAHLTDFTKNYIILVFIIELGIVYFTFLMSIFQLDITTNLRRLASKK